LLSPELLLRLSRAGLLPQAIEDSGDAGGKARRNAGLVGGEDAELGGEGRALLREW
jgi:hypothetical protein